MASTRRSVGDGMDTWHWWCGVDNPGFWREMAKLTSKKENVLTARIDLLRMLHTVPRSERWEKIGLINDPDCVAAEKPDQYGLRIDRMKDGTLTWDPDVFGFSSGVVGLQLFKNKNFDAKKWSIDKYLDDASSVEPPYLVGMACTVCHTAFNPNRPPKNPAEPKWENLDSHIGSQYFREGMLFGFDMPKDTFAWQYLHNQSPGTSETTRFPADFINGPILINSIYRLNDRLKLGHADRISPEQKVMMQSINKHLGLPENDGIGGTDAEPTYRAPRVLATGGDSMGLVIAATRVYVNEGSGYKDWFPTWALNPYDLKGSRGTRLQAEGIRHSRQDPQGSQEPLDADRGSDAEHGALPEHPRRLPAQGCHRGRGKRGQERQGLSHDGRGCSPQGEDRLRRSLRPLPQQQEARQPARGRRGPEEGLARASCCGTTSSRTTSCPTTNATPARSWVRTSGGP